MAPLFLLALLVVAGIVVGLMSAKPASVRVIGPQGEESFVLPKRRVLRIGGAARVEGDLVFGAGTLGETIATVTSTGFGKAQVAPNANLREGTVEVETDEGNTVLQSGETLLTSATITFTSARGLKEVFTVVKEDANAKSAGAGEHFGGGAAGASDDDGADWRS